MREQHSRREYFIYFILVCFVGGGGVSKLIYVISFLFCSKLNAKNLLFYVYLGKPKNSLIIPLAVGLTLLFLFLVVVIFLIFRRTQR